MALVDPIDSGFEDRRLILSFLHPITDLLLSGRRVVTSHCSLSAISGPPSVRPFFHKGIKPRLIAFRLARRAVMFVDANTVSHANIGSAVLIIFSYSRVLTVKNFFSNFESGFACSSSRIPTDGHDATFCYDVLRPFDNSETNRASKPQLPSLRRNRYQSP